MPDRGTLKSVGFWERVKTARRVGMCNIGRVVLYRLMLKGGAFKHLLPMAKPRALELFGNAKPLSTIKLSSEEMASLCAEANELCAGSLVFFSGAAQQVGTPPSWFRNPLTNEELARPDRHWSEISDFAEDAGDIKCIWEASRFDWALVLARAFRATGDEKYLACLRDWGADWTFNNPANGGPNWKCGQETAIRLLQTLLAHRILFGDAPPGTELIHFVETHCRRIRPTYFYARAQNNNHGISEAAGLMIGGSWLAKYGGATTRHRGRNWAAMGRKWLTERVHHLIELDGSFAQYSLNYHRMVIDMLSQVEYWRQRLDLAAMPESFEQRFLAALDWLYQMTDPDSGRAPNLGANDGARVFRLSQADYSDMRPSLQLAYALYEGGKVLGNGPWDAPLAWLDLATTDEPLARPRPAISSFPNGGYTILRPESATPGTWALLRLPLFRFRPSHADALHLDLWHRGTNVLRDSGTYSYNAPEPWQEYFPSVAAHNTLQFDDHDQMPRISRFLFGAWPRGRLSGTIDSHNWCGEYTDDWGCHHRRKVCVDHSAWRVSDHISGYKSRAVLRWRLAPCTDWQLQDGVLKSQIARLEINADRPITRLELCSGWESLKYGEKREIPVLEVEVEEPDARITTTITLTDQ